MSSRLKRGIAAVVLSAVLSWLVPGCLLLWDDLDRGDDSFLPLTQQEAEEILDAQQDAARLYRELVSQGHSDALERLSSSLRENPLVSRVDVDGAENVWITYGSGLVGVVLSERHTRAATQGISVGWLAEGWAEGSADLSVPGQPQTSLQRSVHGKSAVILAYNQTFFDENGGARADHMLVRMGYEVHSFVGERFTLERMRDLGDCDVIVFFTHGGASIPHQLGLSDTVVLHTGQKVDARGLVELWARYRGGIGFGTPPGAEFSTYTFNHRFINRVVSDLPDSVVIAHACSSFRSSALADAFLQQGAGAYLGWTDTSNGHFFMIVTDGLFEALSRPGCSLSDAMTSKEIPINGHGPYSIAQLFPAKYWYCDAHNGGYHHIEIGLTHVFGTPTCNHWTPDFRMAGDADLILVDVETVDLTVYVHEGSETGQLIPEVRVYGEDAAGTAFDATTSPTGAVTISGIPGEWSINASKPGYLASHQRLTVSTTGIHRVALQPVAAPSPSLGAVIMGSGVSWGGHGPAHVGTPITIAATVEDTADVAWTYQGAVSLRRPGGSEVRLPLKPVHVRAGGTGSVAWTYVPDAAGSWDIAFELWKDTSQQTLLDTTGWMNDFFTVEDRSTHAPPETGNLYSFGANFGGMLGHGDTNARSIPTRVTGLTDVSAVAGGHYHTLAVTDDGDVYSFGGNSWGELGHGDVQRRPEPTRITSLSGAVSVAAGNTHSLVLTSNGDVYSFGGNDYGQLGHGDRVERTRPQRIATLSDVVAVAAGMHHSIAITSDGDVYTFGWNGYGQLGHGDTTSRLAPTRITGAPLMAAAAAGGSHHSLVVSRDGRVYSFGSSHYGALGLGSLRGQRNSPTRIEGLSSAVAVSAGTHSLVLLSNGDVLSFGYNNVGQLGLGHTSSQGTPVRIATVSGATGIAAGRQHSLVLLANGDVLSFGIGSGGVLGQGNSNNCSTPKRIALPGSGIWVAAGDSHSLVLVRP